MPIPLVLRHDYGPVAHLVLQSQASRNSLSLAMMTQLRTLLAQIAAEAGTRILLLSGEGPAFCAGHDLRELTLHRGDGDGGAKFYRHTFGECSALMQAILDMPQPVIAVVEGIATAAGCQLVATCDLAIAGDEALFCTPGVDIGLFCSTPMVALTRNIARKHAMEMLLTGDKIDARVAERFGLVNQVVPHGTALAAALALARRIAQKPRTTIATGKRAFYHQADMPLAPAYDHASLVMTQNLLGAEACEGIEAFLQKRSPNWLQP